MNVPVWVNGELHAPEQAIVSVFDHGLMVGDGVFETIKVRERRVVRPHPPPGPARAVGPAHGPARARPGRDRRRHPRLPGRGAAVAARPDPHHLHQRHRPARLRPRRPGHHRDRDRRRAAAVPRDRGRHRRALAAQRARRARRASRAPPTATTPRPWRTPRRAAAPRRSSATSPGNLCEGTGSNIFIVRDGRLITPHARLRLPGRGHPRAGAGVVRRRGDRRAALGALRGRGGVPDLHDPRHPADPRGRRDRAAGRARPGHRARRWRSSPSAARPTSTRDDPAPGS